MDDAAERSIALHARYGGTIHVLPKVPVRTAADFALWYTPGVAAPCRAIEAEPERVYELTNKGNTIAIVTDGTRVLGLGAIGPEAGLPVMEGKALLFKYLGGVDAVPICLDTTDPDEIVRTTLLLQPAFGGVNLEDISQPKCFRVLDALRAAARIPVWHDDQQGTATVVLAGLRNALDVVGKRLDTVRITLVGTGAANVSVFRVLVAAGVDPGAIVACDTAGVLHRGRTDVELRQAEFVDKWRICTTTNAGGVTGGIAEALRGADVCLAFSGPGAVEPSAVASMAPDAIVFACANPVPEIWPAEALAAGARVVATGRSDLPNQVNNSLAFPGVFRGVLDVRARAITDGMTLAASAELAAVQQEAGVRPDAILPSMADPEVHARVAAAVGAQAQAEGLATVRGDRDALLELARARIQHARDEAAALVAAGLILPLP